MNAQTAMAPDVASCPMTFETDLECLETSAHIARRKARGAELRMVRIKNTLELETFLASEPVVNELEATGAATRDGSFAKLEFDQKGNIAMLQDE